VVLAVALLAAGAFFFLDGRGQTFWYDEWAFVLDRRGSGVGTFLEPHNGHLSLVPIVLYKALLGVAGMDHYWPYRLVVIVLHMLCSGLIYLYAERRVGGWLAVAAALPILFLGPAWQVIVWPFEMAWVASLAAGLGALLLLDRGDRRGEVAASALLVLSILSSGLGIAILIGASADVLLRGPRRPWVVAAPFLVYATWYLVYGESNLAFNRLAKVPSFTADALASSVSALVGLAGRTIPDKGASLAWGRPLAVVAVAVVAWRLIKLGRVPPRVVTLGATIMSFWVLTAISRAGVTFEGFTLAPAYSSRYLYVGGFFLVLIAVELLRGVRLGPAAWALLCVALAAGLFSHIGAFRDAGRYLRNSAAVLTTNLGVIELAAERVPDDYLAGPYVTARPFLTAAEDWGSPARAPGEIAVAEEDARAGADFVLAQIYSIAVPSESRARPGGPPPKVEVAEAGDLVARGSCVTLTPSGLQASFVRPRLDLRVPPRGLVLTAGRGGRVELSVRRFAARFPREPLAVLQAGSTTTLRIPRDRAVQPWHMQLLPAGAVTACGVR